MNSQKNKIQEAILLVKQVVVELEGGGGSNTANQGINQANTNNQIAQCVALEIPMQHAIKSNNSKQCKYRKQHWWSNRWWWSRKGGGGTNTASQGINQTNTNHQIAQCVGVGNTVGACNKLPSNPIKIQEATLVVKQLVVEAEVVVDPIL